MYIEGIIFVQLTEIEEKFSVTYTKIFCMGRQRILNGCCVVEKHMLIIGITFFAQNILFYLRVFLLPILTFLECHLFPSSFLRFLSSQTLLYPRITKLLNISYCDSNVCFFLLAIAPCKVVIFFALFLVYFLFFIFGIFSLLIFLNLLNKKKQQG